MRPREFDGHPESFADAMGSGLWRGIGKDSHDGDTLIVFTDKGMFDYQMVTLRILGVNAPEIVGTSGAVLERAKAAQRFVEERTKDKPLLFRTFMGRTGAERMTFDRYLASVWYFTSDLPGIRHDLAAELLRAGLADPA